MRAKGGGIVINNCRFNCLVRVLYRRGASETYGNIDYGE